MVDSADEVHMLPGYKESKGTKIEVLYAQYVGKEVVLMGDEMYSQAQDLKGDIHHVGGNYKGEKK